MKTRKQAKSAVACVTVVTCLGSVRCTVCIMRTSKGSLVFFFSCMSTSRSGEELTSACCVSMHVTRREFDRAVLFQSVSAITWAP